MSRGEVQSRGNGERDEAGGGGGGQRSQKVGEGRTSHSKPGFPASFLQTVITGDAVAGALFISPHICLAGMKKMKKKRRRRRRRREEGEEEAE